MGIRRGRLKLLISTVLSIFAVAVAGVASFAWFQATTTQTYNPSNPSLVTSDTTSLSIDEITAYKAKYAQSGYDQTDYSTYEVEDFSTADATPDNTDKAARSNLEIPSEGEGYYIVGDAGWVADYNYKFDESKTGANDAWKYSSAVKMESSVIKNGSNVLANKAVYDEGIYLSANTEIKMKHHYVDTDDLETHDDWIGTYGGVSGTGTSSSDIESSNGNIKINVAGYYKIYLNNSNAVYFYRVSTTKQKALSASIGIKKTAYVQKTRLFLNFSSKNYWDNDGARIFAYVYASSDGSYAAAFPGLEMTVKTADTLAYVDIENGTNYDRLIFVRRNPDNNTNWNRSSNDGGTSINMNLNSHNKWMLTSDGQPDGNNSGYWSDESITKYNVTAKYRLYSDSSTAFSAEAERTITYTNAADEVNGFSHAVETIARKDNTNAIYSVFDEDGTKTGWYTNNTFTTAYSQGPATGALTLYCKVVKRASTVIYVDKTNASGWTYCYAYMITSPGSSSVTDSLHMKRVVNQVYQMEIPTNYSFVINNNDWSNNEGTYVNQTVDISLLSQDKNGNYREGKNCVNIESSTVTVQGGSQKKYQFTWRKHYGTASTDGYYLAGTGSFSSGGDDWVFVDGQLMSTTNCPTDVKAYKTSVTVTANTIFQIWKYNSSSSSGRDGVYGTKNDDIETNSIVSVDGNNLKFTRSGTYDIWLTNYDKIVVKSSSTSAKLWIRNLNTGSNSSYSASFGTNCTAVYELGVHITDAMAANSGCIVAFVINYGGSKTQYGTVNPTPAYGFVNGTSSYGFDSCTSAACMKIVKPGYYNFYLIQSNANYYINVISRPYATNGSDVLQKNGDYGYYVIPYTAAGFGTSLKNGIKMAPVTGTNHAEYTKYIVASANGESIYFRRFENGTTNTKIIGNISAHSSASDKITVHGSGENQYVTLNQGTYNMFIYEEGGIEKVSIASHSLSDFSTLNSIPSTATTLSNVQSSYTTVALDVKFSVKESKAFSVKLSSIVTSNLSNGLSKFIRYALYVDKTFTGNPPTPTNKWDQLRTSAFANSGAGLKTMSSNTTLSATLSTSVAANNHHAYIVIDYDWDQVANIPKLASSLVNDFYFVMSISL